MAIATEKNIAYIAEFVDGKTPALEYISKKVDNALTSKSSATVDVEIVGYGVVTEGEAVGSGVVETVTVPVTVGVINTYSELGIVQEQLEVGDFKKVVAEPRAEILARYINKKVIDTAYGSAEQVVVGDADKALLGVVSANIQSANMQGKMAGFLAPHLKSAITSKTLGEVFNPSLSKDLYEGVIGTYDQVEWLSSVDLPNLVTGVTAQASGTTVAVTVNAEGATQIQLAGLSSATGTIKKGHVFFIAGANVCDVMGEDKGYVRAFVVLADATVSGSAATITVAPLFFTGPKKNVSGTSIASGAVVTSPLTANSSYYRGVAWNEMSMAWANKPLSPMANKDSSTLRAGNIQIRMSADSEIGSGKSTCRWDTMFGLSAVAGKGICGLLVKMS